MPPGRITTGGVLVTGATGLLGRRLCAALVRDGCAVRALTRGPGGASTSLHPAIETVTWDGVHPPPAALDGLRAVVHLAGEPVFGGVPSAARKRRIRNSRIDSSNALVGALCDLPADRRPRVLVCASAIGFYGSRGDEPLDEDAGAGSGFLADVCRDWEAAAGAAMSCGVRTVMLRIGIVLAREGGALPLMSLPFRFGAGGRLGSGRQWVAWIHADDLVRLIRAALDDDRYQGPVNAVAPEPVRNADLTRELARVLRRPAAIPVPAAAVRLLLGELAGELLGSRRVVPRRADALGFRFEHASLSAALRSELAPDQ